MSSGVSIEDYPGRLAHQLLDFLLVRVEAEIHHCHVADGAQHQGLRHQLGLLHRQIGSHPRDVRDLEAELLTDFLSVGLEAVVAVNPQPKQPHRLNSNILYSKPTMRYEDKLY